MEDEEQGFTEYIEFIDLIKDIEKNLNALKDGKILLLHQYNKLDKENLEVFNGLLKTI